MDTAQECGDVLSFWFDETEPAQWWESDAVFDRRVTERFGDLHCRAIQGELYSWRRTAHGRLAEIIVLDQFSRNIHRGRPAAFANDGMALALAQEAVAQELDRTLPTVQRSFFYIPHMHSESLVIHDVALELFETRGTEDGLHFERLHRDIIVRFGRYPHRNEVLGRVSTDEELAFLQQPGSSF